MYYKWLGICCALIVACSASGDVRLLVTENGLEAFNGYEPYPPNTDITTTTSGNISISASGIAVNTNEYADGASLYDGGVLALPAPYVYAPTNGYPPGFTGGSLGNTNLASSEHIAEYGRTVGYQDSLVYTSDEDVSRFAFWTVGITYPSLGTNVTSYSGYGVGSYDYAVPAYAWPHINGRYESAVRVNVAEAWWVGPNTVSTGDVFSVYGRNLILGTGVQTNSYAFIDGYGWITSDGDNKYKADFTVPAGLANGTYDVYVHNSALGKYGWSDALELTVRDPIDYTGETNTVTANSFASLKSEIEGAPSGSTVIVPAGTYNFTSEIKKEWGGESNVWIKGAGFGLTKFIATGFDEGDAHRYMLDLQNSVNWKLTGVGIDAGVTLIATNMAGMLRMDSGGYVSDCFFSHTNSTVEIESSAKKELAVSLGGTSANPMIVKNCIGKLSHHVNLLSYTDYSSCTNYGIGWTWLNSAIIRPNTGREKNISVYNCAGNAMEAGVNSANRWFVAQNGVYDNIYVGGNTATDIEPPADDNSGEIVLFENPNTKLNALVESSTSTTVVSSAFSSQDSGDYVITISSGRGFGQTRIGYSANGSTTLTLEEAWDIIPNSSSKYILSSEGVKHAVVYDNVLDAVKHGTDRDTASVAVSLYGNASDCIVDGNTASQTEAGFVGWAILDNNLTGANYFNRFADNSYTDQDYTRETGGMLGYYITLIDAEGDGDIPTATISSFANVFVDNVVSNIDYALSVSGDSGLPNASQVATVFEGNSGTATNKWGDQDGVNTVDRNNTITAP